MLARRAATLDESRPEAVERRHAAGARTAGENIDDLVDPGTSRPGDGRRHTIPTDARRVEPTRGPALTAW